jgi:hypothetical protein
MRKVFGILAVAGLVVFGAGAASAQGVVRPARTRTVCRTVMEERVRPSGVVVRRPVERCREVVAGRRVYVD